MPWCFCRRARSFLGPVGLLLIRTVASVGTMSLGTALAARTGERYRYLVRMLLYSCITHAFTTYRKIRAHREYVVLIVLAMGYSRVPARSDNAP